MEKRDYPAIAEGYARDVVAGQIPAGKYVRLQAKRFLAELKRQRRRDFPFRFDPDRASKVCRFIEKLPHSKGKWAAKKETIRLEPWQVFAIAVPFGWVRKDSGLRRFRVIFIIVPRKNGKSAIAAGIGLYMLCADGEFGAEVYSGATNEKQAWEVFKPAKLMADRTPDLRDFYGIEVLAEQLHRPEDGSKFETIIGDPPDGQSPSCAIHDEYHEHPDDDQVETMETGQGARDQPIQLLITTAGDNLAGPCYARIGDERKKLEGIGHNGGPPLDDETFYLEHGADEGDDWKSEETLRKANPNFDISVRGDYLRARQRDAIASPRKAGIFKTKHLNMWVSAKSAYFDVEAWRRCHDPEIPVRAADALALEQLRGRRCIISLDLASKIDVAAMEYLFPPVGEKATVDDPYILIHRYFLPEATVENVAAYQGWDALGLLDVTAGEITDFDEIVVAIDEASEWFQLEHVAYDPFQATMLATTLTKKGVPMLEYRQVVLNFSEPMKQLDALMRARLIAHGGCPVMEWQISNVVAKADVKENVYPNKPAGQPHLKIDNPVAAIAALGTSMSPAEADAPFEYTGM